MWTKAVFMVYLTITAYGIEDDGTNNYLIETVNKSNHRMISISTKEPLPYKENEIFLGRVQGECQTAWGVDESEAFSHLPDNWLKQKIAICNADFLETHKGDYFDVRIQR